MHNQVRDFIHCIDEQRFYDAHEALEEEWFPRRFENSDDVRLLKGFINAAVSFELHKRGRPHQSKKVWANYLKYRQLLFKTQAEHKNILYQLSRYIEQINHKKSLISHSF